MRKYFLLILLSGLLSTTKAQQQYFQQRVNYNLDVTLNDKENTLDGFEKMEYTNNSPDTLKYIWFHLWPNAFKDDHTAFSDQLLQNGRTDFYFSNNDKRGYINRLDFKVNGTSAMLVDHPKYIDVSKLMLPSPLAPGQTITITTPFHVKLPYNFSRGGYVGQSYQVTQWYPKPAVYDHRGWHPMPYLDQGEFYSEFGNFDVNITVPKDYVVAATGDLQNEDEKKWLLERTEAKSIKEEKNEARSPKEKKEVKKKTEEKVPIEKKEVKKETKAPKEKKEVKKKTENNEDKDKYKIFKRKKKKPAADTTTSEIITTNLLGAGFLGQLSFNAPETKTLHYIQNNVHDFAWFADKTYIVQHDTLRLASGKVIDAYSYYTPKGKAIWKNSVQYIKDAVRTRGNWLGEYPYNVVQAVEIPTGNGSGGMEYPTITAISPTPTASALEFTIEHEVGHNWNYGILASNEREHPWMDEGINTYYDIRYHNEMHPSAPMLEMTSKGGVMRKRLPDNPLDLLYNTLVKEKIDQPIEGTSESYSNLNYGSIVYYKTGLWMKKLENYLGKETFDQAMHAYYEEWKFKHPYPDDFKRVVEKTSGRNVDSIFNLLNKRGPLEPEKKKDLKLAALFSLKDTDKHNYIFLAPAVGYNFYDGIMVGGLVHNFTLPRNNFEFFLAPMYATTSKKLAGVGRLQYAWNSYKFIHRAELSVSGAMFSADDFTDSVGNVTKLSVQKLVPSLKLTFRQKNPRSTTTKFLQWKTFLIREQGLLFERDTINQIDVITYPFTNRFVNQLRFVVDNHRALYPYNGELKAEQGEDFMRLTFDGNYFFNYAKGGGLNARVFGGKFIYLGEKTFYKQFTTDRYHLNLTGANGYEDYTYSNYFVGRNEFEGWQSQQIMVRDGGFKVRSDLLASKIGKTDDWLAALNLNSSIPRSINPLAILPFKIPLKAFVDIGTYAEAWDKNATTGKFVYDAGLQLSLFKDILNVYVPLFYSKVYSDYYKSTITEKRFWKNISFSIDIQKFNLRKVVSQSPF